MSLPSLFCSEWHFVIVCGGGFTFARLLVVVDDREEVALSAVSLLGLEPQPRQRPAYFVGVERRSTEASVLP